MWSRRPRKEARPVRHDPSCAFLFTCCSSGSFLGRDIELYLAESGWFSMMVGRHADGMLEPVDGDGGDAALAASDSELQEEVRVEARTHWWTSSLTQ